MQQLPDRENNGHCETCHPDSQHCCLLRDVDPAPASVQEDEDQEPNGPEIITGNGHQYGAEFHPFDRLFDQGGIQDKPYSSRAIVVFLRRRRGFSTS